MVRVTRPGGVVVAADLDNQIEAFHPLDLRLQGQLAEALRLVGSTGFDPRVGRKLYTWFRHAGLEHVRVRVMPYQVYAGGLPEGDLANWRQKLTTTVTRLAHLDPAATHWSSVADQLLSLLQRPDSFYYSILVMVRGIVPRE